MIFVHHCLLTDAIGNDTRMSMEIFDIRLVHRYAAEWLMRAGGARSLIKGVLWRLALRKWLR